MSTPAIPEATEDSATSAGTHGHLQAQALRRWDRADDAEGAEGALVAEKGALGEERFDKNPQRADAMAAFSDVVGLVPHRHQHNRLFVFVATKGEANRVEDVALPEQLLFHATRHLGAKAWPKNSVGILRAAWQNRRFDCNPPGLERLGVPFSTNRWDLFWQVHEDGRRINQHIQQIQFATVSSIEDGYGSEDATHKLAPKITPSRPGLNLQAQS